MLEAPLRASKHRYLHSLKETRLRVLTHVRPSTQFCLGGSNPLTSNSESLTSCSLEAAWQKANVSAPEISHLRPAFACQAIALRISHPPLRRRCPPQAVARPHRRPPRQLFWECCAGLEARQVWAASRDHDEAASLFFGGVPRRPDARASLQKDAWVIFEGSDCLAPQGDEPHRGGTGLELLAEPVCVLRVAEAHGHRPESPKESKRSVFRRHKVLAWLVLRTRGHANGRERP